MLLQQERSNAAGSRRMDMRPACGWWLVLLHPAGCHQPKQRRRCDLRRAIRVEQTQKEAEQETRPHKMPARRASPETPN